MNAAETPTPEPPRRLRAADVIDTLEAALQASLTHTRVPDVTVEFTRNAKGETQIKTQVSAPAGTAAAELEALAADAMSTAKTTYEAACAAYPAGTGFPRNEGQGE
jgi:hypothetical protein